MPVLSFHPYRPGGGYSRIYGSVTGTNLVPKPFPLSPSLSSSSSSSATQCLDLKVSVDIRLYSVSVEECNFFIYLFISHFLTRYSSICPAHRGEKVTLFVCVQSTCVFTMFPLLFLFLWSGWCLKMCWEPKERESRYKIGEKEQPFSSSSSFIL